MGNPLRVLHVVVNMNRGGAETLIMNLYRNLDRSKVQFDFLTCKEGAFDDEIQKMGGNIHRIPYLLDVGHLKYVKELNQFFSNNPYKIVHSHMDKMSGLVLRSAKKAGIPIRVSHSHNTSSEGGPAAKIYKWYIGLFIIPNATNLIACSNKAADWLFKKASHSAILLKNGIDSEQFEFSQKTREEIRKELKVSNKFVIGHVGRFAHQKNHIFLVDVFEKIIQVNRESVMVLVGDGPLRKNIEKKVKELNLDENVHFVGIRSDINRMLHAFDAFVFPSLHEGLPVSLIEAQAIGLPCIISNSISEEVDLGANLIMYEDINKSPKSWAQNVILYNQYGSRFKDTKSFIKNKGYEIKNSAKWLQEYYLALVP